MQSRLGQLNGRNDLPEQVIGLAHHFRMPQIPDGGDRGRYQADRVEGKSTGVGALDMFGPPEQIAGLQVP